MEAEAGRQRAGEPGPRPEPDSRCGPAPTTGGTQDRPGPAPAAEYYPVFLDLRERRCVVLGGDGPAEAKVEGLLSAGARVTVVAERLSPELAAEAEAGRLRHLPRAYRPGDLEGAFLAISTMADATLNAAFFAEAEARGLVANVADDPARSSFIAPAILRRGDLAVAISTAGKAPALAVRLKERLAESLGAEYAHFLALVGPLRGAVAARWPEFGARREAWYRLVDSEVLDLLREGQEAAARRRALEILGLEAGVGSTDQGGATEAARMDCVAAGPCGRPGRGQAPSPAAAGEGWGEGPSHCGGRGSQEPAGQRLLAAVERTFEPGVVYLVGAGPGDPGLITARGLACLRAADVVVYDRLVDPRLALEAPPGAERIDLARPRGERLTQEAVNALLVGRARAGRAVVRLKGGDPFVFGRGGEEAAACAAAGVPCEVVPGVTSAVGVPGAAGIPLTHRGVAGSFAVLTAHRAGDLDEVDWRAVAAIDTVVLLMAAERLPQATAALLRAGRPRETPAAIIEWGTWPGERVLVGTLGDLAERARAADLEPPATVVVGEVVRLRAVLRGEAGPPAVDRGVRPVLHEVLPDLTGRRLRPTIAAAGPELRW